jgi:hypothetical protein
VILTSHADDSVGGDTNADGVLTEPARGDWVGVSLQEEGAARLTHLHLRYAGARFDGGAEGTGPGALAIYAAVAPELSDLTILSSQSAGLRLEDTGGQGYTVSGLQVTCTDEDTTGLISQSGASAVTVEGFQVEGCSTGVLTERVGGLHLRQGEITGSAVAGLEAGEPSAGSLQSVTLSGNAIGVRYSPQVCQGWTSQNLTFTDNTQDQVGCP